MSVGTWASFLHWLPWRRQLLWGRSSGVPAPEDTCWFWAFIHLFGRESVWGGHRATPGESGSRMQACLRGTPGLPGWAGLDGVWFCPRLAVWLGASSLFSLDPFPPLPSGHKGCPVLGLLWGEAKP